VSLPRLRGHEAVRAHLARAAAAGMLPQSVLLYGAEGIGKERLGLWLAQLLVCEAPDPETGPCGACHPCRLAGRVEHPDVHWFFPLCRPEGASQDRLRDKLEEARGKELALRRARADHVPAYEKAPAHFVAAIQTIQQLASVRPAMGRRKVFVVGDAELMVPQEASQEAANAFLKLLEEPPTETTVILTSPQPGALLPTIRSRVLPIRVTPIPEEAVRDYLVEEVGTKEPEAARIARISNGAIGRALRLLPGVAGAGQAEKTRARGRELLLAALSGSATPRFSQACGQAAFGARGDFTAQLESLGEWLRDLLAVASGAEEKVADPDALAVLGRAVVEYQIHPLAVAEALDHLARALELARGNVNPQLILANLLGRVSRELRPATTRSGAR
jgi:DNA polymerase-3 subunit delta'